MLKEPVFAFLLAGYVNGVSFDQSEGNDVDPPKENPCVTPV